MRHVPPTLRSCLTFAVIGLAAGPAPAQEDPPLWVTQLEQQAFERENCKILYTTNPREFELLRKVVVEVRVHCEDGRAFDASRAGDEPFTFKVCEPVSC